MLAMAFMSEILVAKNAFDAYLIISANGTSVTIIGRPGSDDGDLHGAPSPDGWSTFLG
jgi:hypothetical protein